ncbi:MAG: efflux RND transporter periplasmic adaptor subunit [Proteobacteria bacterium]|nr:efflux RND transporter periplasmic adaptor subunit [Pseudomonadota bacterium]MBS0571654.1 efflux RND transporter periplasmic adaptor subunit [Pseudomonadota bacterium]
MRAVLALALLAWTGLAPPAPAETYLVAPIEVADMKALFGSVESRFVIPARSRIGGMLASVDVSEGSPVAAGQVIARIVDDKLHLQLTAADARIAAANAQLQNAESELTRNQALLDRGATTRQQLDLASTTVDVARNALAEAGAARAVIVQQMQEGDVLAPAEGRILTLPMRTGQVVMPGEPVATVAGGGVFLRLAIPERHAEQLALGAEVEVGDGQTGRIVKIYPEIANGRVTADVTVEGLSDRFIGQRVLVRVAVARRQVLAVPEAAILTRSGIDLIRIAGAGGESAVAVVPGGIVQTGKGPMREILGGLRAGDEVILP